MVESLFAGWNAVRRNFQQRFWEREEEEEPEKREEHLHSRRDARLKFLVARVHTFVRQKHVHTQSGLPLGRLLSGF